MDRHVPNTWWHRNHLEVRKYPDFATKKQLIYRVFRAAYPHGAFVDDNLALVELRDKDTIWANISAQFDAAARDLEPFLAELFRYEPFSSPSQQRLVREYYHTLLGEAKYAVHISQNGRYFEFRAMEELLVRYRKSNPGTWASETPDPREGMPVVGGFWSVREQLEARKGSDLRTLQLRLQYDAAAR
ncbi:uncharacterized protein F4822DRAFT_434760 [Hypoxylon trugodes]|uniref:uncharacterized protein n=1 Tax=Hypoxylon trugodes TaxID=326681 RepID=UPI00219228F9|nr:uncharacterized protein F4822DRAFT_434760 [Hypoxylon trugodes]KAI1383644.1 hypothetical protein F4822DRAFT_434760 [Hypoxylon trugodes]